ncbi:hypothetical protein FQA39_LY11226 [Lamprigera yunnana]|nr:hypothetical protein FQA39_LY11226 [Lamprigera yunnana]
MRKKLRQILALEKLDKTIVYSKCAVAFEDEINAWKEKLNVLKDKISIFTCDSSRKEYLVLDNEKTRRSTLVSKVIDVPEQLNVKLKSRKHLGQNDTVSFLISDGSDDGEVSDEERPSVSTSTSNQASYTVLESTNVSENVRRVTNDKTINVTWKSVPVHK